MSAEVEDSSSKIVESTEGETGMKLLLNSLKKLTTLYDFCKCFITAVKPEHEQETLL